MGDADSDIRESCWCCRDYGLTTPATEHGGLCDTCANRSPSACQTAHEKIGGITPSQRLLDSLEDL